MVRKIVYQWSADIGETGLHQNNSFNNLKQTFWNGEKFKGTDSKFASFQVYLLIFSALRSEFTPIYINKHSLKVL